MPDRWWNPLGGVEGLSKHSDLMQVATILAATILFGSTFPAGKTLLQHHAPPLMLAGIRFLLAPASILAAMALLGGNIRPVLFPGIDMRDKLIIAAIGLLQTGTCIGCLFLAMGRISPPVASLLLFTNPIWVAALGVVVLGQPVTANRMLGLALGICGVAVILSPGARGFDALGYTFGLLSSFGWAGATLLTKKAKLAVSPWALTFWQMIAGALALLCMSLLGGEHWKDAFPHASDFLVLLWLAVPASAGAYGLWSIALRRGSAGELSSFLFLVPFFATILSYYILGTTLSVVQLLGGGSICLGLWLSSRVSTSDKRPLLAMR